MESKNPVFARSNEWKDKGYATFDARSSSQAAPPADASAHTLEDWYRKPSATASQSRRMTLDDVVIRTASLFVVLLIGAAVGWQGVSRGSGFGLVIVPALIAMVLGIWAQVSKKVRPGVMFAYAALEGVFVGGISTFYSTLYDGIVGQAVIGTLAAFGGMLIAYKTGVIRNSPRFTKVLMIAGIGYLVFGLANLAFSAFGGTSVYSIGGLGILISAFGVVLASLFLVLDFDYIEQGIRNGLPVRESWRAGFGLMVTLVWLYLEILRLIAILRGND